MKCIICGIELEKYGKCFKKEIKVCPNCGIGETLDFATPKISEYHRDETYLSEVSQFENIFKKRVDLICRYLTKGKVLDVGSSTGTMLKIFQNKGFEVVGVEPSVKAASIARNQNINTYSEAFEKIKFSQDSFDVVILNHTLEHVDDPLRIIKKINFILKPKGILLIDVPNFGSFSSKIDRLSWKYLLPNEHKWHFTKKSLSFLLEKNSFIILDSSAISGIWQYASPISELLSSFLTFKKRFFVNIFTAIPSYFITKFGLGTGLIIIAQKK